MLPTPQPRILISVTGWPDKRNDDLTRVILVQECTMSRLVTGNIVNRLSGLYKLDMRVMGDDETVDRDADEMLRVNNILSSVIEGDFDQ